MSKLKSMKSFFSLGLILILILSYFIMSYLNYINKKEKIEYYKKTAVETSINGAIVQINEAEMSYDFIASRYEEGMKEELLRFSREVSLFKGELAKIDLEKIKSAGPKYYDYYIINSENVIINSTFAPVLGLDFKEWKYYNKALNEIRAGGKIEISNTTTEIKTGKLRKWGYLPTKDKKYLLEIGLSHEELEKYAHPVNFWELKKQIIKNSTLIKDIDIFDQHHMNLVNNLRIKDSKVNADLDEVYRTRKAMDFYDDRGFLTKKYIFFNGLGEAKTLNADDRLLIVKYDNTKNIKLFNDLRQKAILMFLIFIFILVVSTNFFVDKYVVNPIMDLKKGVEKLSNNLLMNKFREYKIDEEKGSEEISSLAKSFNAMSYKLGNTLVSKEYLINIINSVSDIIIITDKNSLILDVNDYAEKIINKNKEGLIGKNITEIFTKKEKIEQLILTFKDKNVKDRDTEIETAIISGKEQVSVIVNIAAYYDKKGNIMGFITSARHLTKLQSLVESMQQKTDKLLEEVEHDQLTGCLNRRGISKITMEAVTLAKTSGVGFSVIMLDIDDFKKVNDVYGHQEGDKVLIKFAKIMKENSRKSDSVVRFGGEEFFLFLPKTSISTAIAVGERIKEAVAETLSNKPEHKITVSGGVSEWNENDEDFDDTLSRADAALYKSKKSGKNQINFKVRK